MKGFRRYLVAGALAAAVFTGASAQRTGISFAVGGATFQMDDMKYLLDLILETYPVEGAVVSSFPPYLTGTISALRQLYPHLRAGGSYTYTSTGARANYTDYTGNIQTDIGTVSHRLGAFVNYSLLATDRLDLSLYGRLDANFSTLEISSSIYVLGLTNSTMNTYSSISPNGSVGLEFLYKFKDLSIGFEGGYLVDIPGKLKDRETGNELLDPNDRERVLTTDWTGWRLGIKGIIWLK